MKTDDIVSRTFLHSAYIPNIGTGEDAVVVSEIIEDKNGNTEPFLRVFRSPKVSIWVTKLSHRTHTDKKELESLEFLDEYIVPYKTKDKELYKILNGYYPKYLTYDQKRNLHKSPYVYGTNISVEALIAIKYKKELLKANKIISTPTTGFFDIERSLLKDSYGKLPLMSFVCENKVFLAIKKSFMYEQKNGKFIPVTIKDITNGIDNYITPLVQELFETNEGLKYSKDKIPFSYEFFVGDTEVDMIRWIFGKMHESKVSFIGVWNIGFDIPEIIKVLNENNVPLEEIFCDPGLLAVGYKYVNYKEDVRKGIHPASKWHWLTATAHFQFIDSMALYSYIRTVEGKEPSYALDSILKKFNLSGKLKIDVGDDLSKLQTVDWHRKMLSEHFIAYSLYSLWDVIGLQIMEWRNNDLTSMLLAVEATPLKFFPNQTIKATTTFFEELLEKKFILGTGVDVSTIKDELLPNGGGAVLAPRNLIGEGLALIEEKPDHHTKVFIMNNDLDFSAQYPNLTMSLNISRQTKISSAIRVTGKHVTNKYTPIEAVEVLHSYLITPGASGVDIATEFMGLVDYAQMNELFNKKNK